MDADTLDLAVDLGFRLSTTQRFRLMGIDAPELNTEAGMAARRFVDTWVGQRAGRLRARTYKSDSFGRWLADIYSTPEPAATVSTTDFEHLGTALIQAGHATPYARHLELHPLAH